MSSDIYPEISNTLLKQLESIENTQNFFSTLTPGGKSTTSSSQQTQNTNPIPETYPLPSSPTISYISETYPIPETYTNENSLISKTNPIPATPNPENQPDLMEQIPETYPLPNTLPNSNRTHNSQISNLLDSQQYANGNMNFNDNNYSNNSSQFSQINTRLNNTLSSMGKGNVLLIKPIDNDKKELIRNPVLLNTLIYRDDSPFNKMGTVKFNIKDIRVNKIKEIIAIEYNNIDIHHLNEMSKIDKIGLHDVKCYIPNSEIQTAGTIHPISLEVSLDDQLIDNMNIRTPHTDTKIIKIERLKRKKPDSNEWEDSLTVKITFSGENCPTSLTIFNSYYKIRPYIPFPLQCWNCQRLGHTSNSCNSKRLRCRKCSGNHLRKDCTSTHMKCANCAGNHFANSKDCALINNACRVEKIRVINNIPYETAKQIDMNQNTTCNNNSSSNPGTFTYSQALTNSNQRTEAVSERHLPNSYTPRVTDNVEPKSTCNMGTQTDPIPNQLDKNFYINLKNFIIDIISISNAKESNSAKSMLTNSAVRNHFGIDLTTDIENSQKANDKRKLDQEDYESSDDPGVLSPPEITDTNNSSHINAQRPNEKTIQRKKAPKKKKKKN